MLNQEREQNYRVQAGNWKLPVPGPHVLTAAQRRRLKRKLRAHSHFRDGSCDRCRPGHQRDTNRKTAAPTEQVSKWERT